MTPQEKVLLDIFAQLGQMRVQIDQVFAPKPWVATDVVSEFEAHDILGDHFIGSKEVKAFFGKNKATPPIPFTREDLIDAKSKGFYLILRDEYSTQELQSKFKKKYKQDLIWKSSWINNDEKLMNEKARSGWAIVSNGILPNTTCKTYAEQTEELKKIYDAGDPNDLRPSLSEILHDLMLFYSIDKEYVLSDCWTWTSSLSRGGRLVGAGGVRRGWRERLPVAP